MNKKLLYLSMSVFLVLGLYFSISLYQKTKIEKPQLTEAEVLRAKHAEFLKNSPFRNSIHLSRKDRKGRGLPPNPYYERLWELTMNPALGYPTLEKINQLQDEIYASQNSLTGVRPQRAPGDSAVDNPWVERGPNNIGGRTRVLVFDPNDATHKRVFAGGVSGGLWVNQDITNANSSWALVNSVPGHLNVSAFAVDPNNPQIMYLGTGEQYTFGAAVGNGVYKSTNGGDSWVKLNINLATATTGVGGTDLSGGSLLLSGIFYINDIIAWNNGGNTEVFIGVGAHIFGASKVADAGNPNNFLGLQSAGLFRSADGGTNWSRIESANMQFQFSGFDFYFIPNDFEIGPDNKLWMGTIRTPGLTNSGGGRIFSSTNGTTWTQVTQLANSDRTEIEISATDPNRIYALTQGTTVGAPVHIFSSQNGTTFTETTTLPDDADNGIPANDFTRGQSFYDLVIEADPTDQNKVYVGGIDLFSGVFNPATNNFTWTQISKWSNNNNLLNLSVPLVHADQHAFVFHPTNANQAIIGNDGGVFFASSLSTASSSTTAIASRNKDYNVTQYYYGTIGQNTAVDDIGGGTQDNGSPFAFAATAGANSFNDLFGGDGAFTQLDKDNDYGIGSFPGNTHIFFELPDTPSSTAYFIVNEGNNGSFINTAALDEVNDVFFSDATIPGTQTTPPTFRLAMFRTFKAGAAGITRNNLTNALLDESITALKTSPFSGTQTNVLVGLLNGKLLKLTNATNFARVWSEITGPSFVGSISDIEFGNSEQEIFVTFHNFGVVSLWYTADGGTTWQDKEGNLPDIPVKAVLQNPLNTDEVILGTALGVWRTGNINDSSPVWVQSQNGMKDVTVIDLDYRPDPVVPPDDVQTGTVLAATHGRGLFTGKFNELPSLSLDDKILANNNIKIFPTVTSGEVNIVSNTSFGKTDVRVYTLSGQEVFRQNINLNFGSTNQIQLQGLSSGLYFIKLKGESFSKIQKLIIRR
ncbi:MAG: T9SS type A sorting domain-containing protein [Flavobacteriaceae bacterium]|nr:T9SS type A sorting domain-containing protein [Flavobacteriaceae bacterium]